MKLYHRITALILAFFCIVAIAQPATEVQAATSVSLNKSTIRMTKGATYTLKLLGTTKKVTWSSSDKSIATVSTTGKVTAKKIGKTTIIAKCNRKTYKCTVIVTTRAKLDAKVYSSWNAYVCGIWNDGFCDVAHYIEDGKDACGRAITKSIIKSRIKSYTSAGVSYNKFMNSLTSTRYTKVVKKWKQLYAQSKKIRNYINTYDFTKGRNYQSSDPKLTAMIDIYDQYLYDYQNLYVKFDPYY